MENIMQHFEVLKTLFFVNFKGLIIAYLFFAISGEILSIVFMVLMNMNSTKPNSLFQLAALATDTIWLLALFGIGIASLYFLGDGAKILLAQASDPIGTLTNAGNTGTANIFYGATFFAMLCLVAVNLILFN
jgi:hypothetical protein